MDKDRKLKRYRRKDYSETVDFPVEIVGRDGVVRRYDFEDSVRLYQRRLSFAPMRYRDDDLVAAEQGHCRARIEQLRRSFFHLHGWQEPSGLQGLAEDHAGELTALLMRVFRERGRLDVRLSRLPRGGPGTAWFVEREGLESGLLLYAWDFLGDRGEEEQAAFLAVLKELRASERAGGDAERLVAYHHTADCAFVLSGQAREVEALARLSPEPDAAAEVAPSAWDEVERFVKRGDIPAAYQRCRGLLEGNPWHREAYVLGAHLALLLGRPSDAEDLAYVGASYFPESALLQHQLGLARLHLGREREARDALQAALARDASLGCARTLLVVSLLDGGRWIAAWRTAHAAPRGGSEERCAGEVIGLLRRLAALIASGAAALTVSLATLVLAGPAGLVPMALVLTLLGAGLALFRQRIRGLRALRTAEDPLVGLERLARVRRRVGT